MVMLAIKVLPLKHCQYESALAHSLTHFYERKRCYFQSNRSKSIVSRGSKKVTPNTIWNFDIKSTIDLLSNFKKFQIAYINYNFKRKNKIQSYINKTHLKLWLNIYVWAE